MYYVNPNVRDTMRIFPPQGRLGYMRLDMNENPEGLPEEVVSRIRDSITPEFLATYPEPGVFLDKYAAFLGVNPNQLCATNGSDNAIRYIMQTFAEPGKKVLTVTPTVEMYKVNCWLLGLVHTTLGYGEDGTVDVDALVEAIDDDTDIVALVNPNNPMGDTYTEDSARRVLEKANEHNCIVVIDEAYHYFTSKTLIKLIDEYENLILLRTFSKCFSLAGVRLGVAIGNSDTIRYIHNLRVTFEVNTFALKCGEIVLDTPGLIESLAEKQIEGREYIVNRLSESGYTVMPSETNFVSFKPKTSCEAVEKALYQKKILVKTFGSGPLKGWIRINTGSVPVMEKFAAALLEVDC